MSHYKSNLRDIEFNLFELFRRQDILGTGPFAEVDEETARDMLAELHADNVELADNLRLAHALSAEHRDVATTSLIENWVDEAEQRAWFLRETIRADS